MQMRENEGVFDAHEELWTAAARNHLIPNGTKRASCRGARVDAVISPHFISSLESFESNAISLPSFRFSWIGI